MSRAARSPAGPRCSPRPARTGWPGGRGHGARPDRGRGRPGPDRLRPGLGRRSAGLGAAETCPGWTWAPGWAGTRWPTCWPRSASVTDEQASAGTCRWTPPSLAGSSTCSPRIRSARPVAAVTAGLRALAQVGDPRRRRGRRADIRRAGGPADRDVRPRRHRTGGPRAGLDPGSPAAQARADRQRAGSAAAQRAAAWSPWAGGSAPWGARVLATYLAVALTHLLRDAEPGPALAAHAVRARRGQAAPATSSTGSPTRASGRRPGWCWPTAASPRTSGSGSAGATPRSPSCGSGTPRTPRPASEQIGTEHRFVISQLTETVGRVRDGHRRRRLHQHRPGRRTRPPPRGRQSEGLSRSTGHGPQRQPAAAVADERLAQRPDR